MLKSWEINEKECFLYLINNYGNKFILEGSHNSNISDIKVINKNYYIEAKSIKSQCGQFVVLEENNKFIYSNKNKTSINEYSNYIINYMNNNFHLFTNVTSKPIDIMLDTNIFYSWVKNFYKLKNVKYFITKVNSNNYIIIPLDNIDNYFNISACYRVKKSGSSNITKNNFDEIKSLLNNIDFTFIEKNEKIFIKTKSHINEKLKGHVYTYQFKLIEKDLYEIRRLSNTNNPNVIFSIELIKKEQDENDLNLFLEDIK